LCDDPVALQQVCDRLGPAVIKAFVQRWLRRLPLPFSPLDERAGYRWELSMRQVEVFRTIELDVPRRARGFFEALIADNLDIGRPANVELIGSTAAVIDPKGLYAPSGTSPGRSGPSGSSADGPR
jgi:hypothetical protein